MITETENFEARINELVSAGKTVHWQANRAILQNDLDEFNKRTFVETSRDFSSLYGAIYPSSAWVSTDPWYDAMQDIKILVDALQLLKHRLRQGQAELKNASVGEHVIEAGTPYTAYVVLRDIVSGTKADLLMVDPYVGTDLFSLLTNVPSQARVRILTWKSRTPPDFTTEAAKFSAQHCTTIEIRWGSEDFHDRFLLVDDHLYMSGGSLKDLGKKLSYVTEVRSVKAVLAAELENRWLSGAKA